MPLVSGILASLGFRTSGRCERLRVSDPGSLKCQASLAAFDSAAGSPMPHCRNSLPLGPSRGPSCFWDKHDKLTGKVPATRSERLCRIGSEKMPEPWRRFAERQYAYRVPLCSDERQVLQIVALQRSIAERQASADLNRRHVLHALESHVMPQACQHSFNTTRDQVAGSS